MAYGDRVLMRDLDFDIRCGDVFFIIGGSGCGKTTLLRHLVGLNEPARGEVWYGDVNFTAASDEERERIQRRIGVLFQSGALWSSMTVAENVGLPLEQFTPLAPPDGTDPEHRHRRGRPLDQRGRRRCKRAGPLSRGRPGARRGRRNYCISKALF